MRFYRSLFWGGGCFAVVKMIHAQIKAFGELGKAKPIRRSFSRFRSAHRRLRGCKKLPASCIRLTPLKFNSDDPKGKARFNQDFFQGQVVKLRCFRINSSRKFRISINQMECHMDFLNATSDYKIITHIPSQQTNPLKFSNFGARQKAPFQTHFSGANRCC